MLYVLQNPLKLAYMIVDKDIQEVDEKYSQQLKTLLMQMLAKV